MRISDWSSDVCSSDLVTLGRGDGGGRGRDGVADGVADLLHQLLDRERQHELVFDDQDSSGARRLAGTSSIGSGREPGRRSGRVGQMAMARAVALTGGQGTGPSMS